MPEEMGGPYISVAAFCQTALAEASRQLSIIRILDQIVIQVPKFPAGVNLPKGFSLPIAAAQITMVIVLKSGVYKGKAIIKVRPISPNGKELPAAQFPTLLEGEERGLQIVMPMTIVFEEEGVYWFEVGLDNPPRLLTKVPLRIMHNEVPVKQMGVAP
jgi:hypothetical protein